MKGGLWDFVWKNGLLEDNISGNVETTRRNMKTFITFMMNTIVEKNTLKRMGLKFIGIVRTKIWPTSTPKNFEKKVIRG